MGVFLVILGTALMSIPVFAGGFVQPDYMSYDLSSNYIEVSTEKSLTAAEGFIEGLSKEGISFLQDETLNDEERKVAFRKLLVKSFDIEKIGRFSMGRYWREATSAQQNEYQKLFKDMIVDVYSKRFSNYKGQSLDVGTARVEGTKDIIVASKLVGAGEPEVLVDWRVRPEGGTYKVIDVIVEGVSMAVTQRSEFSSLIQRGGGSVDVLINHLKEGRG